MGCFKRLALQSGWWGPVLVLATQSVHAQTPEATAPNDGTPEATAPNDETPAATGDEAAQTDSEGEATEQTPPTGDASAPPTASFPLDEPQPEPEPAPPPTSSGPDATGGQQQPTSPPSAAAPQPAPTSPPPQAAPQLPRRWQVPTYEGDPRRREPPSQLDAGPAGRRERVPGDFVARPLTLPRGTFELSFANGIVFINATEHVGWVPGFAFGISPAVEIGVHAPLRHDAGEHEWTTLDPVPHIAFTWLDRAHLEFASRAAVLIPASSNAASHLQLATLGRWHESKRLRVDFGAEIELAFEDPLTSSVRVPVAASFQASPWFFMGLGAAPDVGLSEGRDTGIDGHLLLGLTIQTYDTAHLDFTARIFVENVGAGGDEFSDGGGTLLTATVYPELY